MLDLNSRTVLKWVGQMKNKLDLDSDKRGGLRPKSSLLNSEDLQATLRTWVGENSIKRGESNMTLITFTHYVNEVALPALWLKNNYSTTSQQITDRLWLHRLGFKHKKKQRGVYIDGHDAPENVAARLEWCEAYREYMLRSPLWITRRQISQWLQTKEIPASAIEDIGVDEEILPIDQFPDVDIRKASGFGELGGMFCPSLARSCTGLE